MSIELTEDQRQALAQCREVPPRVLDPAANITYVLVRADVYEKLQDLLGEEDVRPLEPLLAELAPEDWEDASHYETPRP
jgi:hypothetical protein